MANIEDTCISLTNPIEADSSSATKLSDSLDIVILPSTTTININSNVSNNKEIHPRSVKKQKIADNILLSNISRRLAIRKNLHKRLLNILYLFISNKSKMANIEDTCISLTNPIEADSSSATKLSDSLDIVILPSTTTITTNSNVSNNKEIHPRSVKKQKIADNILLSNISRRLAIRKNLHKRLSFVTDIMCFLGILGIILMIIENEIKFSQINNNDTMSSWCIKIVISCSTIILIGFIFQYHRLKLFLYAVNNSIQDSRATLTNRKIFLIILEILICAIHPVPHSTPPYLKASLKNIDSNSSISTPYILSYIDIDVALGLPMFARFYLICRSIVFHSHLFRDSSS
ncbi:unnamed protein product [Rotaria sordida]|uniref:Uncharacterized protein n=1 Tax=Rotaria sordida TaxID=392033 RepID=A0A815U6F4_9BILA|nr:unnamed protein product [Rotaria sordida]